MLVWRVRARVVTGLCPVPAGPFDSAQGRLRPATTQSPSYDAAISGVAANSLRVYACCGWVVICSVVPISTILP
jgi:hypothetical protein